MSVHHSFFFTSRKTLQVHLRHIRATSHRQPGQAGPARPRPANMCTLLCLPPPPCIATFIAWQLSSWQSGRYRTAPRGYSWPICQVGHDPTALAELYYNSAREPLSSPTCSLDKVMMRQSAATDSTRMSSVQHKIMWVGEREREIEERCEV